MSSAAFAALFDAFLDKVNALVPEEAAPGGMPSTAMELRRDALDEARLGLGGVLARLDLALNEADAASPPSPAAVAGGDEGKDDGGADDDDEDDDGWVPRSLEPIERLIGEKMHDYGDPHSVFAKFDSGRRGFLTGSEFQHALAAMGITASDAEMAVLMRRYGDSHVFDWAAFTRVYDDWRHRMSSRYGSTFHETMLRRPLTAAADAAATPRSGGSVYPLTPRGKTDLIDAVRGKLYASYDTATEAFLALTDHATSGAETVSASQLVEHLIAKGLTTLTQQDILRIIWPYAQTKEAALTLAEFSRFMVGADPEPPKSVPSYMDHRPGRRRSVTRMPARALSAPAIDVRDLRDGAAGGGRAARAEMEGKHPEDYDGYDGPVADTVPQTTFDRINSAVYASRTPLKVTFDKMCTGATRTEGASVNDLQRGLHGLGVDVSHAEVRRLFLMFVHHGKKHRMSFPEFVRLLGHGER